MQDFLIALGSNPLWYGLSVLISLGMLLVLVRPSITTFYDPWLLQQILTAFASASVIFMWKMGIIELSLMLYHIVALTCFMLFAGIMFRQVTRHRRLTFYARPIPLNFLRDALLLVFIVSQLLAWSVSGIPLLLESRLDAFSGGSGIGVFSRLISFTSFATVFLTVLRVGISHLRRFNLTDIIALTFATIASVASGSKTNIAMMLVIILMSNWVFQQQIKNYVAPRVSRKIIAGLAMLLLTLLLVPVAIEMARGSGVDASGPVQALFIRLVLSGDGYMWMYGDNYLSLVTVSSPIELLFSDFLGLTRLMSWDQLPVHPGLQIYQSLFSDSDAIRGPNLRVDTFGLLFGSMEIGIAFAAVMGGLFGWLRGLLFKARSALIYLPAAYLFFQAPAFFVDPVLGVTALVNATFGIVIVGATVAVLGRDPFSGKYEVRLGQNKLPITASAQSSFQ